MSIEYKIKIQHPFSVQYQIKISSTKGITLIAENVVLYKVDIQSPMYTRT